MKKVAVLGTSCLDRVIMPRLTPNFQFEKTTQVTETDSFGGSMHNIAYHLALLGANVTFYTKIGDDALSSQLVEEMKEANVNVVAKVVQGPCPVFTCLQDASQKIYLSSVSEDYFYHGQDQLEPKAFEDIAYGITDNNQDDFFLHLMAISPKTKWVMNARKIPLEWFKYLDGYILNREEMTNYDFGKLGDVEAFASHCLGLGLNWLIVTLDKDGLAYFDETGGLYFQSLAIGSGVSLGCGDAFSAGLMYARSMDLSMQEAIQYGLKASALIYKKSTAISKDIVLIK